MLTIREQQFADRSSHESTDDTYRGKSYTVRQARTTATAKDGL
jgi:hypothetical protein